ncbi:hypothetical protein [Streptomyces sp. NPDC004376]
MAGVDVYGQSIGLWAQTDPPDIPGAIALFAKGILPRLRLTFASASARGATLVGDAAPTPGMMTWLSDVGRLDIWDGSAWVAVSTGASAWKTITPASPWTQNGNNNGTWQYRLLNISGEESLQFRGGLARSSYPSSPSSSYVVNNAALPTAVRPGTPRTVLMPCSDVSSDRIALKMDVRTDGYLEVFGFGSTVKPPWIGFNGITVSL